MRRVLRLVAAMLIAPATLVAPAAAGGQELPPPVEVRSEPLGVTLVDPTFEPLPGARADFGRLGGAVYQIEIPDDWNGRLVLQMHGFADLGQETSAAPPDIRRHLIERGYAWGASSFSSSSFIPSRSVDETAALWDYFARTYGRPERTYITGISMGGLATHLAAERYPDRFDGALALCGSASVIDAVNANADFFAAAAYAAGLTQPDFDDASDTSALIDERILPALAEPDARRQFEDLMIDLTGDPRPFARAGFRIEVDTNWRRVRALVATHLAPNADTEYRLGPASDVPSDHFNRFAIRLPFDEALFESFREGPDVTGELAMPVLSLHTTGDGQVPFEQARLYQRLVDKAGASDQLVQRIFADPGHCGFRTTEQEAAFDALVRWVERGVKPKGSNVLVKDFRKIKTFELSPRDAGIPGKDDRVTVRGRLSVDGEPLDAQFLGAVVLHDGLVSPCQFTLPGVENGRYEITVSAVHEVAGCGRKGARIALWTYVDDTKVFTTKALRWPGDGKTARFDGEFTMASPSGATPAAVEFNGEVFDQNGRHVAAGTRVEAYVGDTLCGVGAIRRGSYSGYIIAVVGPESVEGCERGTAITWRVGGRPARGNAVNVLGRDGPVDLTVQ